MKGNVDSKSTIGFAFSSGKRYHGRRWFSYEIEIYETFIVEQAVTRIAINRLPFVMEREIGNGENQLLPSSFCSPAPYRF